MTIAKKIEEVLKNELEPQNIKTVIDMAEFLKFKENQNVWSKINEEENEYVSEEERLRIEEIKLNGEFITQDDLLKELGINKDEIYGTEGQGQCPTLVSSPNFTNHTFAFIDFVAIGIKILYGCIYFTTKYDYYTADI